MLFTGYVETNKIGSRTEFEFEIADEDLEGLSDQDRQDLIDEECQDAMWSCIEYGLVKP